MARKVFRSWDELEEHEKDRGDYIQRIIEEARAKRVEQERRKEAATRLRLYGPLKAAGRKRVWKKGGGQERLRDEKGRFL